MYYCSGAILRQFYILFVFVCKNYKDSPLIRKPLSKDEVIGGAPNVSQNRPKRGNVFFAGSLDSGEGFGFGEV